MIMTRLLTIVFGIIGLFCVLGCEQQSKLSVDNRDNLIGWYKLPNRHYSTRKVLDGPGTLIPVFKRDGTYYSICRGVEVPLKPCENGLEWNSLPSSMKGTTIGYDCDTDGVYIIIEDAMAKHVNDNFISGEKQFMFKIDKPSWILDSTAPQPKTNDDFIGFYTPQWFPYYRWNITKEGEKYILSVQASEVKKLPPPKKEGDLSPLDGELGFKYQAGRKNEAEFTYNPILKRFELNVVKHSDKGPVRVPFMPLVKMSPQIDVDKNNALPPMKIGIPSWH